jgi:histidine triad (HIT) family protein
VVGDSEERRVADCLFCRIVKGEVAAQIVHESAGAVAFLDRFPAARGHALVIPRAHAPTLTDLDDAAAAELFLAVKAVSRKIASALGPVAFNFGWNHGGAAGQHVFHLHVHVIPRYAEGGRGVQSLGDGSGAGAPLADIAEAIRRAP